MLASGLIEAIRARVPGARFEGHRGTAHACGRLRDPVSAGTSVGDGAVRGGWPLPGADPGPTAVWPGVSPRTRPMRSLAWMPLISISRWNSRCTGPGSRPFISSVHPSGRAALPARQDRASRRHDARVVSIRVAALRGALDSGKVRRTSNRRRDRDAYQPDRGSGRLGLGHGDGARIVALLPGSRMGELRRLAEPLARTARWVHRRRPDVQFVAPLVGQADT